MRRESVAVFLDRDGTINQDIGYLGEPESVVLIDGAAEAIGMLNQRGIKAIIITNQSGVARGYFSEQELEMVNQRVVELLAQRGAKIDGIYYCPHHPDDGCGCRKPMSGLLRQAAEDFGIELASSYMVGDKPTDVLAATGVGAKGILIAHSEDVTCGEASYVCSTLLEAVRWILNDMEDGDG